MFRDQQKKSSTFRLLFFARFFLAVCDIHSVWAVLLVILNEVEVLSTICSVACVLSYATHTQHARNMACCAATQRCNLRCFALLPLTGRKKGRTPFKRLAVPENAGKKAQNIVNYSVAWPRNTPCCVHVAYVLRMTKPTQRCEGCKILKCL